MADEWADGYEVGLEQGYAERDRTAKEAEKQARAEVLAACIATLEERRAYHEKQAEILQGACRHKEVPYHELQEHHFAVVLEVLRELQPAASDLEALLREARLDEARWWHKRLPVAFGHNHYCCKRITELKAELEKARALKVKL